MKIYMKYEYYEIKDIRVLLTNKRSKNIKRTEFL